MRAAAIALLLSVSSAQLRLPQFEARSRLSENCFGHPELRRISVGEILRCAQDDGKLLTATLTKNPSRPTCLPLPQMFHEGPVFHVGGVVKAPVLLHRVEPVDPEVARKARISGVVILEVLVDRHGVVREEEVLKPLPFGLDQAAIDAVKQWTFRPATRFGRPVNVLFDVTVRFEPPQ